MVRRGVIGKVVIVGVLSRPVLSVDSSEEHALSKRGEGIRIPHGNIRISYEKEK